MTPRAYCKKHGLSGSAFGRRVGTSKFTACRLVKGSHKASPKLALAIEKKTRGEVTVYDLRPDIFKRAKLPTAVVAENATDCQVPRE